MLSCTPFWLYSVAHETAVSQKYILRDRVSTKCTFFVKYWYAFIVSNILKIYGGIFLMHLYYQKTFRNRQNLSGYMK